MYFLLHICSDVHVTFFYLNSNVKLYAWWDCVYNKWLKHIFWMDPLTKLLLTRIVIVHIHSTVLCEREKERDLVGLKVLIVFFSILRIIKVTTHKDAFGLLWMLISQKETLVIIRLTCNIIYHIFVWFNKIFLCLHAFRTIKRMEEINLFLVPQYPIYFSLLLLLSNLDA